MLRGTWHGKQASCSRSVMYGDDCGSCVNGGAVTLRSANMGGGRVVEDETSKVV